MSKIISPAMSPLDKRTEEDETDDKDERKTQVNLLCGLPAVLRL